MKKVTLLAASVLAAAMMAPVANAYTPNAYFGGYFRSGVNHGNGGKMSKFNVNKVGRLGNEDDSYGEIFLGADVAQVDDTVWTVNTRLTAMSNNRNRDWQQTNGKNQENNEIALREFNLTAKGLMDWDKDAVVWAGKRFYKREDIHITDMYYYDISGYGAGIEDLQVGPGKLSLAWLRQDDNCAYEQYNDNGSKKNFGSLYSLDSKKGVIKQGDEAYSTDEYISLNKLDARYNFALWDGASLQVSDTYYMPESQNGNLQTVNKASNANTFGLELNIGYSIGWNKSVVQWMHGSNASGVHYGSGNWLDYNGYSKGANGWRFLNFGDTAVTDRFKLQHVFNVAYSSGYDTNKANYAPTYAGDRKTGNIKNMSNVSLVIRPMLQLTKMTKLVWEAGMYYDKTKRSVALEDKTSKSLTTSEHGQKITMAYAITPDASNVWSRPEIRFFVSYIHGSASDVTSTDAKDLNGNTVYAVTNTPQNLTANEGKTVNHNTMFGVQVEAWW